MSAKKPDKQKIQALLEVSLQERRKWIDSLNGKGTVSKVLVKYPGLKDYDQVSTISTLLIFFVLSSLKK